MSISTKNIKNNGFSLLELLVVISIFTIITTIALFDQGRLNSNVLLTNLAYDVALTVREAQAYGVGVKFSGTANNAENAYGIYIDLTNPDGIEIFRDVDDDGIYDVGGDGVEKTYKFSNQRGNQISALCGADSSSWNPGETCPNGLKKANSNMSITFKRPNPEANFIADGVSSFSGPAYIVLKSQDGTNCRAVAIGGSGQIRVEGSNSVACNPL